MSNDYITVITTDTPCNKAFSLAGDQITKTSAPPISDATAKTVHIPTLSTLKHIIDSVSNEENKVLVLGYVPGTEGLKSYRILSKKQMREAGIKEGDMSGGVKVYSRTLSNFTDSTIIAMDYDLPKTDDGLFYTSFDQVDLELTRRLNMADVGFIRVASNSGRIRIDGKPYGTQGNNEFACHYYIKVDKSENVQQMRRVFKESKRNGDCFTYTIKTLYKRMLDGKSVDSEGTAISSTFDYSVLSPERVIYEGKPVVSGDKRLTVVSADISHHVGKTFSLDYLMEAQRNQWVYGEGQGWFDNVRDDVKELMEGVRETGRGANGIGRGTNRTLPNDTVFETQKFGEMTFEEYALSDHGKLRCQSLREGSGSWAGFLDRSDVSNKAQHYDTVDDIQYMESEPLSLLAEGFEDESVDSGPVPYIDDDDWGDAELVDPTLVRQYEAAESIKKKAEAILESQPDNDDWGDEEMDSDSPLDLLGDAFRTTVEGDETATALLKRIEKTRSIAELENTICPAIGLSTLNETKLVVMRKAVIAMYSKLSGGITVTTEAVKKMTRPPLNVVLDRAAPSWCNDWVYLLNDEKYMNLVTGTLTGSAGFNAQNGIHVPFNENGQKAGAVKFTNDSGFIPMCEHATYLPHKGPGVVIDMFGQRVANSYLKCSVPVESSVTDAHAVEVIKRHIKMVFGDDADMFTSWLAYNVQFPGKLLRWAPLVVSFEGVGKTTFSRLLGSVMGERNVSLASLAEIKERFTGWAEGAAVVVMEEIRVAGQNRHEVAGQVKDKITNKTIRIEQKNGRAYTAENATNYIIFTNEGDALPIKPGDRRWWIIIVKISSEGEMIEYIKDEFKMGMTEYFQELYRVIENYGPQLRRWLLDYELADEFKQAGTAPKSDDKLRMIETEHTKHDGYEAISDVLEAGYENVSKDVVIQADFIRRVIQLEQESNVRVSRNSIMRTMDHLGWVRHRLKWNGTATRILTRMDMENSDISAQLEAHNLTVITPTFD